MFTVKDCLLICEFIRIRSTHIEADSLANVANSLLLAKEYSNHSVVTDMAKGSSLDLRVTDIRRESKVTIYIITNISGDICILCDTKEKEYSILTSEENSSLIKFIRGNISGRCVITGTGLGGLYAGILARQLNIDAIVFGSPSTYEFTGNIKNYLGENEPVAESVEKAIFLKQKLPNDSIYETLYETLLFDEDGNVIICEQSDYSKFVSWFYNLSNQIDKEVWKIFFKEENYENSISDNDLLSIYLRMDELNVEGIQASIDKAINYISNKLEENMRKTFDSNVMKLPYNDFHEEIYKFAHRSSLNAAETIKVVYDSTQTILMGISVFSFGEDYNSIELMNKFSDSINEILQFQSKRLVTFLENQKRIYLESLFDLPELFQINKEMKVTES